LATILLIYWSVWQIGRDRGLVLVWVCGRLDNMLQWSAKAGRGIKTGKRTHKKGRKGRIWCTM